MPISGRFSTISIRLPIHIEAIRPQNSAGLLVITCGPGWMLWMVIAPTISAITALGGIPSVSSGMKDVCAAALLADSGPATPSMAPLPNSWAYFDVFFSSEYAANEASEAPPPGRMPSAEPSMVPRSTAGIMRRKSSRLGKSPVTRSVKVSRCSFCSRLAMISAKPNRPIASAVMLMPSVSSGTSNENRAAPELTSVPTRPSSRPRTIMATALTSDPDANTTAPIRPSTISEKYSAGPNLNASSESGVANAARISVATLPAKKEPSPAVASATPARPRRAIW
ncbi:hypothetical protein D3C72_1228770 [compost metagenome]